MASTNRVAIVGDGVVAGFAALAAESAGWKATVMSVSGTFTTPPAGAFYLHQLPTELAGYPEVQGVTALLGDDPDSYSARVWGRPLPTSIDKFRDQPRVETLYPFHPEMMTRMFQRVDVLITGYLKAEDVLELQDTYDRVIVTVPVSFLPAPKAPEDPPALPNVKTFYAGRAQRGRFYDALVESSQVLSERYSSGLLNGFGESQSMHQRLQDLMQEFGTSHITLYSADMRHFWIRATQHSTPGAIDIEFPEDTFSIERWRRLAKILGWNEGKLWRLFHELRTSLKWTSRDLHPVRKIDPENAVLNRSPSDKILLTGRWATWERKELSHETYERVNTWLSE